MTNLTPSWRRRLKGIAGIATAALLVATMTQGQAAPAKAAAFDLDNGNALTGVIYPHFSKAVRTVTPLGDDAPLVADHILTVETAWFDAIAPYHETAVGIYSNLGRRPRSEATTRNRNIAVIYSAYTSLTATFPNLKGDFDQMMAEAGLDPNNRSEDTSTPAGLGIMASKKVLQARKNDGSNRDGTEGRKYNPTPYADYSGYQPRNTASEIKDPSHWQPQMYGAGGIFKIQQFITPFWGQVKPVSFRSASEFHVSPPVSSDVHNREAYKAQADEILTQSASLDDNKKMLAEFWNDKINALGKTSGTAAFEQYHMDVEKAVQFVTTVDIAIFDVSIPTFAFKRQYDSVRPITAIRYLYGDKKITAWGGPGKGTVKDITGNEWRPYLTTADHTEYPSASSAYCMAYAQAARRFLGSDNLDITVTMPKGSSFVEPGITPAADVTLHWGNLTDMANACRMSRVIGGVHFRAATVNVEQFAPQVGDSVYNFVQSKLNGH